MSIRRRVYSMVIAMLWVGVSIGVAANEESAGPERSKEQFEQVMERLDTGGDLLVVANVEGWLEDAFTSLGQLVQLGGGTDPSALQAMAVLTKLPDFLRRNGFFAVRGFGMSIVPREDGFNDVRTFISRDSEAALLPLWRACCGTRPKRLAGLDFMPADTVMARACAGEPTQVWALIRSAVAELGGPAMEAIFQASVARASTQLGTDVDALIATLGKEGFFSVQLARDRTIELPKMAPGQDPVTIPAPSLLIGLAVANDALAQVLTQQIAKKALAVQKAISGDVTIQTITLPMSSPIPVHMSFATCDGMLLIGSGHKIIEAALSAHREKNGLPSTPEFAAAFENLPLENNGLVYMDPRFGETLIAMQTLMLKNMPQTDTKMDMALFQKLAGQEGPQFAAMVVENVRSGVLTRGISSSSGRDVAASMLVAPVGMLAAIAIPSFVKARGTSQRNGCINNLRQIDAAKEQWAMANTATNGASVVVSTMVEYIRGTRLPECPGGGTYTINPVGTDPTCSKPGHRCP